MELFISLFFSQKLSNSSASATKDPRLGHVNKPNTVVFSKSPEFSITYHFDKNGFRYNPEKNGELKNSIKILTIGDSFTLGAGNNYKDVWSSILERELIEYGKNVEVINAGVSGYGTAQTVAFLERLIQKVNPQIVLLGFLPNDLYDINIEEDKDEKIQLDRQTARRINQENLLNFNLIILLKRILYSFDEIYCKLFSLTSRIEYYQFPINNTVQKKINMTKDLILKAFTLCNREKIDFKVISIPQQFQVIVNSNSNSYQNIDVGHIDRVFSKFSENYGFDWVKTLPALTESYKYKNKDLYYRYDGHLNPEGNNIVARSILSMISNDL